MLKNNNSGSEAARCFMCGGKGQVTVSEFLLRAGVVNIGCNIVPIRSSALFNRHRRDRWSICIGLLRILYKARSEERRVGKECRCRWAPYTDAKKTTSRFR